MAKFTMYVETNYVGSRSERDFEVPDEDLEDVEGVARDQLIEEYALDARDAAMSWGWFER